MTVKSFFLIIANLVTIIGVALTAFSIFSLAKEALYLLLAYSQYPILGYPKPGENAYTFFWRAFPDLGKYQIIALILSSFLLFKLIKKFLKKENITIWKLLFYILISFALWILPYLITLRIDS